MRHDRYKRMAIAAAALCAACTTPGTDEVPGLTPDHAAGSPLRFEVTDAGYTAFGTSRSAGAAATCSATAWKLPSGMSDDRAAAVIDDARDDAGTLLSSGFVPSDAGRAERSASRAETKVDYNINVKFDTGDSFGLAIVRRGRVLESNIRLIRNQENQFDFSGCKNPENLHYNPDDEYYLYYPHIDTRDTIYLPQIGEKVQAGSGADSYFRKLANNWVVKENQQLLDDFKASDLMIGKGVMDDATSNSPTVKFTLHHKMAMIVVDLSTASSFVFKHHIQTDGKWTEELRKYPIDAAKIDFRYDHIPYFNEGKTLFRFLCNPQIGAKLIGYVPKSGTQSDNSGPTYEMTEQYIYIIDFAVGKLAAGRYSVATLGDITIQPSLRDWFCIDRRTGTPQQVTYPSFATDAIEERMNKGAQLTVAGIVFSMNTTRYTDIVETKCCTIEFSGLAVAIHTTSPGTTWSEKETIAHSEDANTSNQKDFQPKTTLQEIKNDISGLENTRQMCNSDYTLAYDQVKFDKSPAFASAYMWNKDDGNEKYLLESGHIGKDDTQGTTSPWFLPATGQCYDMLTLFEKEAPEERSDATGFTFTGSGSIANQYNKLMGKLPESVKPDLFENDVMFWSSTFYSEEDAWGVTITGNGFEITHKPRKTTTGAVRPIIAFGPTSK